jgi:hypothetical protein
MIEHAKERKRQAILQKRKDLETRLLRVRAREKRQQELYESGEPRFKKPVGRLSREVPPYTAGLTLIEAK